MEQQDIRGLRVADIVHEEWPTLGPDETVEGAIKLFAESGVSGAPVIEDGRLVGIVTEGDLIFRDADIKSPGFLDILGGMIPLGNWDEYRREALKSAGVTVGEVMTRDVITVSPGASLADVATAMAEEKVKILPVAESGALRGVVTRMDILTLHVLNPAGSLPVDGASPGFLTPGRTRAEIDLGAVRHNVRALKRRAPGARLMAVVKADAYGHGAVPVSRAAVRAGADSLAVVTVEEGAELRRAGVTVPILVFTDLLPDALPLAGKHRLAVTAHSITSARRISAFPDLEAHLKVNTGMNRWGVEPDEVGEARKILGRRLGGVYTHFASADSDPEATRLQVARFDAVLADHPFGGALVHAANSAATLWHPGSHYDCVRTGVALYGLHPKGDEGDPRDEDLRPAMSLKSYVAGLRRLSPGDGVSYGLTFEAEEPTFAATVPVGYAEGYRRALSGKSCALVRGRRRPLLGRVTMDACVFGVDGSVEEGDEVVLLGGQGGERVGAEELGSLAGTINYELTTGVNPRRVERSYNDVQGP